MKQTSVLFIAGVRKIYSDLEHLLGQENILIRQVERWEGKLSFSEADPPHLIILDCPGSGVDGLAVCQEIRHGYSGLLVLVSEYPDERFHVLALGLSADASLPIAAGAPLVAGKCQSAAATVCAG